MAYTRPVKFTVVNTYGCGPDGEDDVYTVEVFKKLCKITAFIDCDGHGHPVLDSMADPKIRVTPSRLSRIPSDATHIVWFNR